LDYVEIGQVLSNLVENAAKFSPPGSEIGIRVARDDGDVQFEVRDHGPGIAPADAERIFAPFVRVARAGQGSRGVGLGLAIASRTSSCSTSTFPTATASRSCVISASAPARRSSSFPRGAARTTR